MYAHYVGFELNIRDTIDGDWGAAVLADWVGMLTGTISAVAGLSEFADKNSCFIQGGAGTWEVYDADANSKYPGQAQVLRKLCVDGLNYQYMYIAFNEYIYSTSSYLNGQIGYMGGWDLTTKAPTTYMQLSNGQGVNADSPVADTTATNLLDRSYPNGRYDTTHWDQASLNTNPPVAYKILDTPALMTFWAEPTVNAISYPKGIIAEYENQNVWNTPDVGITPILYSTHNEQSTTRDITIPYIRNSLGHTVTPDYASVSTVMGNSISSAEGTNSLLDAARYTYDYTRDATGNRVIPVLPIDVITRINNNGWLCYNGRLRELFTTLKTLFVSDTFTIGADTYVVIPTYGYSANLADYSPDGKLCARIQ